jgi:hypothetical protein
MITDEGLKKFIELYKLKYGIDLSPKEAFDLFSSLINIVKLCGLKNEG